jgi:hypothetical protein
MIKRRGVNLKPGSLGSGMLRSWHVGTCAFNKQLKTCLII